MAKSRPTKKWPHVTCTIGSSLTAVELKATIPVEQMMKPFLLWTGNVIDLIYSEESSQLSFYIRHTKIVISTANVVISVPRAEVQEKLVCGT